jgi:3-dehydroquinate synthase
MEAAGFAVHTFVFPHGEASKTPQTLLSLVNEMAQCHLTRSDCAVALGGGVVGDLCGFAASVYLRGIPFVQMPTTLLAAVDASIGGKTAVDLPAGKNLMGSFYQPYGVFCDVDTFTSLPPAVFSDGCAEVIKYAMLGDDTLFSMLEKGGLQNDPVHVVAKCVKDKCSFFKADETDLSQRMFLNFGHTVAHAIEAKSGYTISHGRAVGMGMHLVTAQVLQRSDGMARKTLQDRFDRMNALLLQYGLEMKSPYAPKELLPFFTSDKKQLNGKLNLVVPSAEGGCKIAAMTPQEVEAFFS